MTADLKHSLRKIEFPANVKEALIRIEALIARPKTENLAMQLISEFIFLETETRKGGPFAAAQLSSIQEFQLILSLIEYFSEPSPDSTRNALFLLLFGSNPSPQRLKLLCRLVSTSISGSVAPLLSSAGAWMQQVGCLNAPSLEVAQSIVSDFIKFSRKTSEQLKQLPLVAPNFAANLMTAVADLYMNDKPGVTPTPPPENLLDVFTEWVTENPGICLASQQPPAGVVIPMPVTTPLAGLIRWTVLAPLVSQKTAYSDLHLALLQTMMEKPVQTGPATAINAQHLTLIVPHLLAYATRFIADKEKRAEDDPAYQKCMERFAQAIQVAIASKCIFGNIPQLLCMLQTLPPHRLMNIIIKANKPTL